MAIDDSSTVKLQPIYDPLLSATVTNATVTFSREPTFNDVYGSGASPMIVAHDRSIQRIPPSRRIETISSIKSFGVERRESLESVSNEVYDAAVREREAFRVRVQQLEDRLRVVVNENNIALRNRDIAIRECKIAIASLNNHREESISNPFRLCSELLPPQNVRVVVKRRSGSGMVARRDFKKGDLGGLLDFTWLDGNDNQVDVDFDPVVAWRHLQSVKS